MPEFEVVPLQQAMSSSSTRTGSDAIGEYIRYIGQLGRDEAGKVTASDGETVATVRRRLGSGDLSLTPRSNLEQVVRAHPILCQDGDLVPILKAGRVSGGHPIRPSVSARNARR